mgnify:CR=1 FL=1
MEQIPTLRQEELLDLSILHQIHDGQMHAFEHLNLIFKNAPVGIFWKDENMVWQGCNKFAASIFGRTDQNMMVGCSDFDLFRRDTDAEAFRTYDQEVRDGGVSRFNEIKTQYGLNDELLTFSFTSLLIHDASNNITGITGLVIPVVGLTNMMSHYLNDMSHIFRKGENYYIVVNGRAVRLTAKQATCLTYISTGKTMKQIASILNCCPRTIEDHVDVLKKKLDVYETTELRNCFWNNPVKWF